MVLKCQNTHGFYKAYHFVKERNYLQQITKFSQLVKIMPCIKIKGLGPLFLKITRHPLSFFEKTHTIHTLKAFRMCSYTIDPQLVEMSLGVSRKLYMF